MSASCDVTTAATLFLTQENYPCLIWAKAAVEAYADLQPMMKELRAGGASLQAIADKLNADGHTTRRGAAWNATQVARVLARSDAE
jgi:hypothetical protein